MTVINQQEYISMTIARNINAWREFYGWSWRELSRRTGISRKTFYRIDHGLASNLTTDVICLIAETFGITFNQLTKVD